MNMRLWLQPMNHFHKSVDSSPHHARIVISYYLMDLPMNQPCKCAPAALTTCHCVYHCGIAKAQR